MTRAEKSYPLWCVTECDPVYLCSPTPAVGKAQEVRQKNFCSEAFGLKYYVASLLYDFKKKINVTSSMS